jgi:hypothetical protein
MVMTERPGQIILDLPVRLPRPRSQELVYDSTFVDLARCIRESIREHKVYRKPTLLPRMKGRYP